jgi:hypothetical protein
MGGVTGAAYGLGQKGRIMSGDNVFVCEGDVRTVPLLDLVRWLSRTGAPSRVEIWAADRVVGELMLTGADVDCWTGTWSGEEAFNRLVEATEGRFRVFRTELAA